MIAPAESTIGVVQGRARPHFIYVTPAFPPIAAPEALAVLKKIRVLSQLARLTVIAAEDVGGFSWVPPSPDLTEFVPPDVEIRRVPWRRPPVVGSMWSAVNRLLFMNSGMTNLAARQWARSAAAELRASGLAARADAIVTNSSPVISHLVGESLLRSHPSLRWIQHYSDPFVDPVYRRHHVLSDAVDRWYERRFLDRAHLVTVTCPETRDFVLATTSADRARLAGRIAVVPHVYDRELIAAAVARHGRPRSFDTDGVHLAYVGNFYGRRSIQPLGTYVDRLRRLDPALGRSLRIHVFGSMRPRHRRAVHAKWPDVFHLHGPVSYLESLAVAAAADLLVLVDANVEGVSIHFPSKLADYLGTGRPILGFTPREGASARILGETGHRRVDVEPSDEQVERTIPLLRHAAAVQPPPQYAAHPDQVRPMVASWVQ